jgi:transcriptional regulator with XRE-family HTH domain
MDPNAELGDFLRSRRSRLSPEVAGVTPSGAARRVPGLRREEVAHLAGVSTDYYARLEQGRHPHVSEEVLLAVARALRLDHTERGHLLELARPRARRNTRRRPAPPQRVRPELHRMLEVLNGVAPALVLNDRRDVLAANQLARALFTDFESLAHRERNFARYVLLDPAARDLHLDWHEVAQGIVGNLRLAAGRHPDDPRLNELIGELCVKVPEFHGWWNGHRVHACARNEQHLFHPTVGELTLNHEMLSVLADPDQTVCVYTAELGSPSQQALSLLASWTAPDADRRSRG